jgi:hypothetical protein
MDAFLPVHKEFSPAMLSSAPPDLKVTLSKFLKNLGRDGRGAGKSRLALKILNEKSNCALEKRFNGM